MTTPKQQPFAERFQPVFYIEVGRLQQIVQFAVQTYGEKGLAWGRSEAGAFQAMINTEAKRSKYKGAQSGLCTLIPMAAVSWFVDFHRTPKAIGNANSAFTFILQCIRHMYICDARVGLYEFKYNGSLITYVDPRFIQPIVEGLIQIPIDVYYGKQQMDPRFTYCPYIPKESTSRVNAGLHADPMHYAQKGLWEAVVMKHVVVAMPKGGV